MKLGKLQYQFFERQRSLENFNLFYDSVLTECQELTDEPKLPRQRRVPQRSGVARAELMTRHINIHKGVHNYMGVVNYYAL